MLHYMVRPGTPQLVVMETNYVVMAYASELPFLLQIASTHDKK